MRAEGLRLAHAPIIEAIVEINCDLPPGLDLEKLQTPAKEAFHSSYPKALRQMIQHQEFRVDFKTYHESKLQPHPVALQFLTDDERQIVQIRTEGYSFNRLAPYGSLDEYLPEIERTWNIFRQLAQPVQIRAIGLRFINRILLPTINDQVMLDQYLKVNPYLPDETLEFSGFLNQQWASEVATGNRVNMTLVAQPQEGDRLPIILDIETFDSHPRPPAEWSGIREAILSLRRLKNRVFKGTLTPECLNLFQPP